MSARRSGGEIERRPHQWNAQAVSLFARDDRSGAAGIAVHVLAAAEAGSDIGVGRRHSGDDIRRDLVFDEGDTVAQMQFALL